MLQLFLVVMFMVFGQRSAFAEWDPTRASLVNATQRMRQVQRPSQDCPPGNPCNHLQFLQTLETRDYESRFFGALKSRAPACQIAVDKTKNPQFVNRFANAQELARHFASRFPEVGAVNHQRIASCSSSNDASSRYKVSKFYSYMARLNEGATRAYEEVAAINSLLGEKENFQCEGRGVLDGAHRRCEELNRICRSGPSQLDQVAQEAEKDEVTYLAVKKDLRDSQRCLALSENYKTNAANLSATNPRIEKCEQVFIERQAPRQICRSFTWEHLQKMQQCEKAVGALQLTITGLESKNPWFRSENYAELRKTKSVKDSIREQVRTNRTELKKLITEFRNAGLCVNGFLSSQACNDEKVRAVLSLTPDLETGFHRDPQHNVGNLYLDAQACIEEGVRDQNATARVLNTSLRDAGLTILTAGLSTYAMGAKALWTMRGAGSLAAAGGVAAINAKFFSESFAEAKVACAPQEQEISVATRSSQTKECPGPTSQVTQAQRAHASCLTAAGFATLDALPFVPLSSVMRSGARLAERSRVAAAVEAAPPVRTSAAASQPQAVSIQTPSGPVRARPARAEGQSARRAVVRDYANRSVTTPEQNAEWVKLDMRTQPDGKTIFLDVQNGAMKRLNDSTADKDLVTALTNKNSEIVSQKVQGVLVDYPTVEAIPYSDFKGIRYAFRPKPPATSMPVEFQDKLNLALEEGKREFASFVRASKTVSLSEDPAQWFDHAFDVTGDMANTRARFLRRAKDTDAASVQTAMTSSLSRAESLRSTLARELHDTPLVQTAQGQTHLSLEVFELSRKSSTAADLQSQISKSMGVETTIAQAQRILDYSRTVDEFSPSLHIVHRQNASLTDAAHGGISIDFKGVGGQNLQGTARALAGSTDLQAAVAGARKMEAETTRTLRLREQRVREAIEEVASANNLKVDIRVSGDDMVVLPNRAMTTAEKEQIAHAITGRVDPATIRMSTIPSGVSKSRRAELATIGENIEKQLRQNLQGQIPKEKLNKLLFSIDMHGKSSGSVASLRTTSRNVDLTDIERKKIDEAFDRAVTKLGPHASPAEMRRNAALSPKEKLEVFEDVNNLPRGYASNNPTIVDEVARIENQYRTPVSDTPAVQRPRSEREALVAKRQELRQLGFTDQQIRRGMNQGIFGSPATDQLVKGYKQNIPVRLQDVNSATIPGSSYRNLDLSKAEVKPMPTGRLDHLKTAGTQAGATRYSEIVVDGETLGVFTKVLPRQKLRTAQGTSYRTEAEVAREAHMTRLLSDLGYGPRYIGSRALPNGNFEIATEFVEGVDFNVIGRGFERKVQSISMEQIERAEKIALDLNDRGIYTRELQFMVSGNKVHVIDPEQFEFMDNAARLIGRRESILSEFKDLKEARRKWEAENLKPSQATGEAAKQTPTIQRASPSSATHSRYGGANNAGIEVVQTNQGRVFAKVQSNSSNFANEAKYARTLADQGIGPRFRGTFTGSDGRKRLAYDYIEGTDVALNVERSIPGIENLPDSIIPQMREINRKLVGQGINPVDIQYRVDASGKVYVIDTEKFTPLPPALQKTILQELESQIDEIERIQQEARRSMQSRPGN